MKDRDIKNPKHIKKGMMKVGSHGFFTSREVKALFTVMKEEQALSCLSILKQRVSEKTQGYTFVMAAGEAEVVRDVLAEAKRANDERKYDAVVLDALEKKWEEYYQSIRHLS